MSASSSQWVGIVSNCWKVQLGEGQTLRDLIGEASRRQFRAIELRQGFLGEYESRVVDSQSSAAARKELADLASRFPEMQLNLAVSLPVFGGNPLDEDSRFDGALAASIALARDGQPHLRLVDTESRVSQFDEAAVANASAALVAMTRRLVHVNGLLSIEHAYQSWSVFWATFLRARLGSGPLSARLRCCFDPCNLLLTEPTTAVPMIVESIRPDDVSMIHLKQRADGQIQPDVAEGDLDWATLLRTLRSRDHRGPWLFEVAPHPQIWDHLDRSVKRMFG